MEGKHVAGAIVAAGIAGAIGTTLWMLFVYYTHFRLSIIIGGGVGWLIGYAAYAGSGNRGNETVCWIGGIIAFTYILAGVIISNMLLPSFVWLWSIFYSVIAIASGVERGFRTPEMSASNDV